MPRVNRRSLLKAVGAGSLAGMAGCSGIIQGGGSGDSETLTFGMAAPYSGPYSLEGEYERQGAQLAVSELNDDGGVLGMDVELETKDTEADANTGTQRLQEFIDDDVDYVMTGISSAVARAMQPLAAENDVVLMHGSPSDPTLTGSDCTETAFRVRSNVVTEANAIAPYLVENYDSFLYFGSDYNWGQRGAEEYEARVTDAGKEWLGAEFPPLGADDFGPFFNAIDQTDPDVVIAYIAAVPKFVNQMEQFGYRDDVVLAGTGHLTEYQLLDSIGAPAGEGIISAAWYSHDIETEMNQSFFDAFTEEYDQDPQRHAESNYSAVKMMASAIESAGTTETAEVIPELEQIDMETPIGRRAMRADDHQAALDHYLVETAFDDDGNAQKNVLEQVPGQDTLGDVRCSF